MTRPQPTNAATTDPRYEQVTWDRPADRIRADADAQYARIRARTAELRPEALRAAVARTYVAAKAKLDALGSQAPVDRAASVAKAKRALFAIDDLVAGASPAEQAAMQLSFRDAQARAAQAGPDELRALFDAAAESGDELLIRAVGARAMQGGAVPGFPIAPDVVDEYLSARPSKAAAAQALDAIQATPNAAAIFEHVVPRPSELSHLNDAQIAELARTSE